MHCIKTCKHKQITREHYYKCYVQLLPAHVASICNVCTGQKLVSTIELLGSITINVACSCYLHACICKSLNQLVLYGNIAIKYYVAAVCNKITYVYCVATYIITQESDYTYNILN